MTPVADEREAALYLNEKHAPEGGVIATLGEKGAFWTGKGETISSPAFMVPAVDTTGAGDAFAGGLIYARLLRHWDMGTALAFANACGAIKCRQPGPRFKANEKEVGEFIEVYRNEQGR